MEKVKRSSSSAMIISLLIAVALWAYVAYQESTETTRWIKNVPITVIGTEELDKSGFSVVETDRTAVDVKLKGDRSNLAKVGSGDITVLLDVSEIIAAGQTSLSCDISVDKKNIDIADAKKSSVVVTAEKITTDIYPVSTNIVGEASKGYSVFEPSAYPTEVTIRGAESVVSSVASVSTKSVSVSGVSSSNSVTVGLTAFDEDGKAVSGVTFEPASVEVSYIVLKEKSVPLEIVLNGVPFGKKVTYEPQTVKVYGDAAALAEVSAIKTEAVDASGIKDGDVLSLSLTLPYGIHASSRGDIVEVSFTVTDELPPPLPQE